MFHREKNVHVLNQVKQNTEKFPGTYTYRPGFRDMEIMT